MADANETKPKKPTLEEKINARMEAFENRVLDILETKLTAAPAPQTVEEKKIAQAAADQPSTDSEFDKIARDMLEDYLDHTEVKHANGAVLFTVVIKPEKSNAGEAYLKLYKSDRRTCNVAGTGKDGVIEWCKLVRANLKKTERT